VDDSCDSLQQLDFYSGKTCYATIPIWKGHRATVPVASRIAPGLFGWIEGLNSMYSHCTIVRAAITDIIRAESGPLQSSLPSLDRNSRSNLSRALSPEHVDESAGFCSGGPPLAPSRIDYSFHIIYI
jgi:hypothetical protein